MGPPVADTMGLMACGQLWIFLKKYSLWILTLSGFSLRDW